ncbi:apolipoprotein N-acyltransferase, partial [Plesiomonas shigelloides]|nr:apolipoprotein N-acyltransferase [Plesiomonas shigelloides]
MQTYFDRSRPYLGRAELVIWPEAAIPPLGTKENELRSMLDSSTRSNKSSRITGVGDRNPQTKQCFTTGIVLGDPQETYRYTPRTRHHQRHPVLYGPYVPLHGLLREPPPLFNLPVSTFSRGDYLQPEQRAGQSHLATATPYEVSQGSRLPANILQHPATNLMLT